MASRALLLAAFAITLTSAQVSPGCTTNSFAIPSWWVNDLKISSNNALFRVINRANNYTADLNCPLLKDASSPCTIVQGSASSSDSVEATIEISEGIKAQVALNHTWTCRDRSNLTFTAVGNDTIPLKCTGQACEAVNPQHLVKGALLEPVALTPRYPAGPPGHDFPGCASLAMKPVWDVSRVEYIEPTGDGLDTAELRTFSMLIMNPHTRYIASCFSGDLGGGRGATETGIVCAGTEFNDLGAERYRINTTVAWDVTKFELKIKQNWYCDDVNAGKPVLITASATQTLDLECTNRPLEGIPNGNERRCESGDNILVTGKLDSTAPLPPYSLTDPVPIADSCTISSILKPAWTFSSFKFKPQDLLESFDIILQTPRRGYATPIGITRNQRIPDTDGFHSCLIDDPDTNVSPLWPSRCLYKYDHATKALTLKAWWICSELDPAHPVEFTGLTTTTIKSNMVCEEYEEARSECVTDPDPGYRWTESIAGVTWQPALQ